MIFSQSLLTAIPLPISASNEGRNLSARSHQESHSSRLTAPSEELRLLGTWFDQLRAIFLDCGYSETYIGGSSAREILDHLLRGAPLALRDLDIYLIKGDQVVEADVTAVAGLVEAQNLAVYGEERIRPKLRANPALSSPECYQYQAGLGVHLYQVHQPILSLGIFHHESDLDLNGLFTIDNVFLRVDNHRSIFSFFSDVTEAGESTSDLVQKKLIRDCHSGYDSWCQKSLKVMNWCEVERCFARHALRIVRTYSKSSRKQIDQQLLEEIADRGLAQSSPDNMREFFRGLYKIISGKYWSTELYMLGQLGALTNYSPVLSNFLRQKSPEELDILVQHPGGLAPKADHVERRATAVAYASGIENAEEFVKNLSAVAHSSVGKSSSARVKETVLK